MQNWGRVEERALALLCSALEVTSLNLAGPAISLHIWGWHIWMATVGVANGPRCWTMRSGSPDDNPQHWGAPWRALAAPQPWDRHPGDCVGQPGCWATSNVPTSPPTPERHKQAQMPGC